VAKTILQLNTLTQKLSLSRVQPALNLPGTQDTCTLKFLVLSQLLCGKSHSLEVTNVFLPQSKKNTQFNRGSLGPAGRNTWVAPAWHDWPPSSQPYPSVDSPCGSSHDAPTILCTGRAAMRRIMGHAKIVTHLVGHGGSYTDGILGVVLLRGKRSGQVQGDSAFSPLLPHLFLSQVLMLSTDSSTTESAGFPHLLLPVNLKPLSLLGNQTFKSWVLGCCRPHMTHWWIPKAINAFWINERWRSSPHSSSQHKHHFRCREHHFESNIGCTWLSVFWKQTMRQIHPRHRTWHSVQCLIIKGNT
jgi:hypothetical protein